MSDHPSQQARRPADAYRPMADMLGPDYFLKHPPESGTRLYVTGRDRVRTVWDVPARIGSALAMRARRLGLDVTVSVYTPHGGL